MSSSVCPRTIVQQPPPKDPAADCALGKKMRKLDNEEVAKGIMQSGNPNTGLEATGPLPNEIFELLNEFWRPSDVMAQEQHMLNGKRRNVESPGGEDQIEDDKEVEDDLTSMAEQEQEMSQDRNTSKRRYSRLSDGYERLKTVLPSVKDKRRVSKARILDEAINYIQRLESITNVLKREHEKRLQMLNGGNGFFPDYSMQPYMRSIFPKQMYHQGMTGKITPYTKMNGSIPSPSKTTPRLKQPYQYSSPGAQSLGSSTMSPDYTYQSLGGYNNNNNNNNNNSIYGSDPSQLMSDEASPIANTSPYNNSACSLSPGTPTSYQNGTVNNSWPYHQPSMSSFSETSSQMLSHVQSRPPSGGYASSNTYATLTNGMWNGMGLGESSSQVVPHGEHSMKVG